MSKLVLVSKRSKELICTREKIEQRFYCDVTRRKKFPQIKWRNDSFWKFLFWYWSRFVADSSDVIVMVTKELEKLFHLLRGKKKLTLRWIMQKLKQCTRWVKSSCSRLGRTRPTGTRDLTTKTVPSRFFLGLYFNFFASLCRTKVRIYSKIVGFIQN